MFHSPLLLILMVFPKGSEFRKCEWIHPPAPILSYEEGAVWGEPPKQRKELFHPKSLRCLYYHRVSTGAVLSPRGHLATSRDISVVTVR